VSVIFKEINTTSQTSVDLSHSQITGQNCQPNNFEKSRHHHRKSVFFYSFIGCGSGLNNKDFLGGFPA
jgi:hypothetical protein